MIAPVCYTLLFRGLVKLLNIGSAHSITGGYHHVVFPGFLLSAYVFVNANLKAVCSMHAFYPTACVSTHAVVLCDMNGRQMPLSPAPTSSSVPLGLIRRGYVSRKYIGPSVTP